MPTLCTFCAIDLAPSGSSAILYCGIGFFPSPPNMAQSLLPNRTQGDYELSKSHGWGAMTAKKAGKVLIGVGWEVASIKAGGALAGSFSPKPDPFYFSLFTS